MKIIHYVWQAGNTKRLTKDIKITRGLGIVSDHYLVRKMVKEKVQWNCDRGHSKMRLKPI